MKALRAWFLRLVAVFGKRRNEQEFAAEMESNLEMHIEDNVRAGMSREEARRQALLKFGDANTARDSYQRQSGLPFLETLWQDIRYGARMLRKSPGFTAVAVLTLALGIGANTAIFSVINAVLLRPLPYKDSERLVAVWAADKDGARVATAVPDFQFLRQQNRSFERLAGYYRKPINVTDTQEPERTLALMASSEFFPVLGTAPANGRAFLPQDEEWGQNHVAIISDGMWRRSFGSDPATVGRTLRLNGEPYTIVGILAPDFWFLDNKIDLVVPLSFASDDPKGTRSNHFLSMVGRLRSDTPPDRAAAELKSISKSLAEQFQSNQGVAFNLEPLHQQLVSNVRLAALVLMGAVGFVLLITCGNLASLLIARAIVRERETSIRTALGATSMRLLRQFLAESLLLTALGGASGVLLAQLAIQSLRQISPAALPRAGQIDIDSRVLLLAAGIAVLTGIVFGLIPVLHTSQANVSESLKEAGRHTGEGSGRYRVRATLVAGEIALALVLLAGAGLMVRSLNILTRVDAGFEPANVLTFSINLPASKYLDDTVPEFLPQSSDKANIFLHQAVDGIRRIPGVVAVGAAPLLPISGNSWGKVVTMYDRPLPATVDQLPPIEYRPVVGDYFQAMGIRLVQGRVLDDRDTLRSAMVAVVNQEFVRRYLSGQNPIGKIISVNPPSSLLPAHLLPKNVPADYPYKAMIVGVVGNARNNSLHQEADPLVYCPYSQEAEGTLTLFFTVRTDRDPYSVMGAVRHELYELDKDLPLANISSMDEIVSASIGQARLEMLVLGVFGALALALSGVGIYGLMSYSVAQRTREIGIRIALGARWKDVMRTVMKPGLVMTASGLLLGAAGAVMLTRTMKSMIFGISATDPVVLAGVCGLLAVTALVAIYFPAQRAAKIDPQSALRGE